MRQRDDSVTDAVTAHANKLPELLHSVRDAQRLTLTLRVPPALAYFPGHFPVHAILPGVVQIDWAIHFGRMLFPLSAPFKKMEALKFQAIIEPGQELTLLLEHKPDPAVADSGKLVFTYDSARGRHSSGRIVFATPGV